MNTTGEVLKVLADDARAGRVGALCVVVETRGSTPQAPGAVLAVRAGGQTVGTLGGGCVEADVVRQTLERLARRDPPTVVSFTLDHDYGWDDGLICGGQMAVAICPVEGALAEQLASAAQRVLRHEAAEIELRAAREQQPVRYRLRLEAPPRLLIAGAGHVGQALARLAVDLDFHVTVIDDRADFAARERFDPRVALVVGDIAATLRNCEIHADTFVVIVTRGHRHDQAVLEAVIARPAGYIGMIGSRRKSRLILRELARRGVAAELIERVHAPIGLPIGAVTVNEIAVSIAAELIQQRRMPGGPAVVELLEDQR